MDEQGLLPRWKLCGGFSGGSFFLGGGGHRYATSWHTRRTFNSSKDCHLMSCYIQRAIGDTSSSTAHMQGSGTVNIP